MTADTVAAAPEAGARGSRLLALGYAAVALLGAMLMFVIQPLIAKALLPGYGGSFMVWAVVSAFFQGTLVAGYLLAHLLFGTYVSRARGLTYIVFLIGAAAVPAPDLSALATGPTAGSFVGSIMGSLARQIGFPCLVLMAGSVTLQRWWQAHPIAFGKMPWFVFAASNFGSLAGLLAFPTMLEPTYDGQHLAELWHRGLVLWAILLAGCLPWRPLREVDLAATLTPASERPAAADPVTVPDPAGVPPTPTWAEMVARWALPAFAGTTLLGAVTNVITLDLAPVPLLWVVPLAIYLATMTLAFTPNPPFLGLIQRWAPDLFALGITLGLLSELGFTLGLPIRVAIMLFLLATLGLAVHATLATFAPSEGPLLTTYYVTLACGGWLGSLLVAVVIPAVASGLAEWPLALMAAAAAVWRERWWHPEAPDPWLGLRLPALFLLVGGMPSIANQGMPTLGALLVSSVTGAILYTFMAFREAGRLERNRALAVFVAALGLLCIERFGNPGNLHHGSRNHYGIYRVYDQEDLRLLCMGSTIHGTASLASSSWGLPGTYYHPTTPIGRFFARPNPAWRDIGVVGLGAGTIAAFASAGQTVTFYELDPDNEAIARRWFPYLASAAATVRIVTGDGRASLRRAATGSLDLLLLDAFNSDAIPTHLLTLEALAEYRRVVRADGLILCHITNRHLDLAPMLTAAAQRLGLTARLHEDLEPPADEIPPTRWFALGSAPGIDRHLGGLASWTAPPASPGVAPWTDRYSSLWASLEILPRLPEPVGQAQPPQNRTSP